MNSNKNNEKDFNQLNQFFKSEFYQNSLKDDSNSYEFIKDVESNLGEHKGDFLRIAELLQSKDNKNIDFNIQSALLENIKRLIDFQEKAYNKLDSIYTKIPNQDIDDRKAIVFDLQSPFQIIKSGITINKLYVLPLLVKHITQFSDVITFYQKTDNGSSIGNAGQDNLFQRVCKMYAEAQLITNGNGYYLTADDFDLMDVGDYSFFLTLCVNGGNNWAFSLLKQLEKEMQKQGRNNTLSPT